MTVTHSRLAQVCAACRDAAHGDCVARLWRRLITALACPRLTVGLALWCGLDMHCSGGTAMRARSIARHTVANIISLPPKPCSALHDILSHRMQALHGTAHVARATTCHHNSQLSIVRHTER